MYGYQLGQLWHQCRQKPDAAEKEGHKNRADKHPWAASSPARTRIIGQVPNDRVNKCIEYTGEGHGEAYGQCTKAKGHIKNGINQRQNCGIGDILTITTHTPDQFTAYRQLAGSSYLLR